MSGRGLPPGSCSYWRRALGREATESIGPLGDGSQEWAERMADREEAEDAADPPCGTCHACLASERAGAVAGVLAELGGDRAVVWEDGGRLWVDLVREPDLLAMGPLLERLRAAGAQAVRLERWECGSGDEVSSGPRLVAWIVPEE